MYKKWKILQCIPDDKRQRSILTTRFGLFVNIAYGIFYGVFGIHTHSWWFLTLAAYYILLSVMKYAIVFYERKHRGENAENERRIKRFVGVLLLVLTLDMIGTVILSVAQGRGTKRHEIVMIAIATYSFAKITFAIVNFCKTLKDKSPLMVTVRCISLANAFVSIFALQRSMLVTFDGMSEQNVRLMNILTGIGVCVVLWVLGLYLLRKEKRLDEQQI